MTRVWAKHQTISDPDHRGRGQAAAAQAGSTVVRPPAQTEVEQRPLTDYDTALGVRRLDGGAA